MRPGIPPSPYPPNWPDCDPDGIPQRSSAAEAIGREGMVTIWDDQGRYLGCLGIETWKNLLAEEARRGN